MKDYLELRKEELKKRGNKGFTLMEMLIVVAIIAVLIAIAIPIFTSQLENSREATDAANLRSAYAEVSANYLTDNQAKSKEVTAVQTIDGWSNPQLADGKGKIGEQALPEAKAGCTWTVAVTDQGVVSITKK